MRLRRFYWDDAFHCLAWSILLVNAALYTNIIKTIYDVTLVTTGGGILTASFLENEVPRYINFQFVTNLLFWSVLWSVKLAFLLFYRRFFKGLTKHMIAWWCVLAFTLSGYIASVSIFLNVCGPPAAYFQISKSCVLSPARLEPADWSRIDACLTEKSIAHTKLDIIFSTAVDISSDLMSESTVPEQGQFEANRRSHGAPPPHPLGPSHQQPPKGRFSCGFLARRHCHCLLDHPCRRDAFYTYSQRYLQS